MDNLIRVGSSRFKLAEAYRFKSSLAEQLPFEGILYASAKFGGPVAITADSRAHLPINNLTSLILDNILIYYNNGELCRQVPRNDLHKAFFQKSNVYIVGMDFLPDEKLIILARQGIYNIIEPITGTVKVYHLREIFFEEHIIEAKFVGRMVVFYTSPKNQTYKFYFIRDIENPIVQEFTHSEFRVFNYEDSKIFFLPIPSSCSFSGKIECFVTSHKIGAYRLIEDEVDKPEFVSNVPSSTFKKLPEIKEIQCMALSPIEDLQPKKMAILNSSNVLHIISLEHSHAKDNKFKIPMLDELEQELKSDKHIFWCGPKAVMIVIGKFYVLATLEGECKSQMHRSKGFVVFPELDCIRIFSDEKCEILQLVPDNYSKIFLPTSKTRAADLYNAYVEQADKNLSPENSITIDKRGLEEGVMTLLDGAYFETKPENQQILLKAAAYGKSFLSKANSTFKQDYFGEVCKKLRVMNSLKSSNIARLVTHEQFLYLDSVPKYFIDILLKYRLYYLANEIAQFLGYDKEIISQIYIEWACCKIEQNPNDDNLAEKIFERLKNDENASYAQIARKAYESSSPNERARKDLALKIIQYEPSIHKRVIFLLWIEQYEQALIEASRSMDPNLIDLAILRLAKDAEEGMSFWKMVSENGRARPRLFKYIYDFKYQRIKKKNVGIKGKKDKNKDKEKEENYFKDDLDVYLENFANPDERAAHYIWRCFVEQYEITEEFTDPKDKKVKIAKKLEPLAAEDKIHLLDESSKLKIKNTHMHDMMNMYKTYLREDKGDQPEKPIVDVLKDKVLAARELEMTKKYKISEKMVFTTKLRAYLEQPEKLRQNDAIDRLLEEKNKKGELLSYYEVVNLMIDYGLNDKAEKYAVKIKNWDEQLFVLKYLATTTSLQTAIDQAISMKKTDDLVDLGRFVEQVELNPGKYPNIKSTDGFMEKIEKAVLGKK